MSEEAKRVATDLLKRGLLSRYAACPVCGSTERSPHPLAFHPSGYLAVGAAHLGISEEAFFDAMEGQICLSCATLYFDPWLSLGYQKRFYEELCPQHNLGWYTFWSVVGNPGNLPQDGVLYQKIREKIPSLKNYAELGCPFNGLLPYLSLREFQFKAKRFQDYPGCYSLSNSIGKYPQVRGNRLLNLERVGHAISSWFNRLQLLRAFSMRRLAERGLIRLGRAREIGRHGINCYYIRHEASTLWGNSCRSLGVDCRTALENAFAVKSLNLEDIQTEKIRFDLVAIFNSLDHYKDPLNLLCRIFEFTDHIYLEGHHSQGERGKQHFYFLEKDTIRALSEIIPLADVVSQFKGRLGENWYSVLLRRRSQGSKTKSGFGKIPGSSRREIDQQGVSE